LISLIIHFVEYNLYTKTMKSAIMVLLGAASAVKLGDAPDYFNEPTWHQTWPSATGLV